MKAKDIIAEAIRQMSLAVTKEGLVSEEYGGRTKRDPDEVTYIAIIGDDEDGEQHIHHVDTQACHWGLKEIDSYISTPKYVVHRIQWEHNKYRQFDKKVIDSFLRWLTVKSPYAKVFVTKGGKPNRERGYLVTRCNVPDNLMAGGLFAARMLTEHFGSIVWSWWKLVERGVHPNIAFVYAHLVSCKDHENVYIEQWEYHTPLTGKFDDAYVENFYRGEMYYTGRLYKDSISYDNVHATWSDLKYDNPSQDDVIELRNKVMSSFVVKAEANPFKKERIKEICPVDMFMDLYAPYILQKHAHLFETQYEMELNVA